MKLQKIMMSLVFGGLILLMLVLTVLNGFI
jgi:hypothetical protein